MARNGSETGRPPPRSSTRGARLIGESRNRGDLSLDELAGRIYASLDPAATIVAITESSLKAIGADRATAYVADASGLITEVHTTETDATARAFIEQAVGRVMDTMPVWVRLTGQRDPVLLVDDAAGTLGADFRAQIGAASFAGVRLERGDGAEFLGAIFCSFRERHAFTCHERSALRTIGALACLALTNARLFASTERGLAEARARADGDRTFRLLAENSTDVITRCDQHGIITYMSPAGQSVLGVRPDDACGRRLCELLDVADLSELAAGRPVLSRLLRGDTVVWVETTARRVVDPDSDEAAEIQASTRDVTVRQQARERLQAVAREQAALRRVTATVADGLPEREVWAALTSELATVTRTGSSWLVQVTDAGGELVGASTIDGRLTPGLRLDPADLDPLMRCVQAQGSSGVCLGRVGSPLCGPSHRHAVAPILVDWTIWGILGIDEGPPATAVRDRGHLEAFTEVAAAALATLMARSERDMLESGLRQSQKLEAVGQLAAGIAHEINTPIQFVGDSVAFLGEAFSDISGLLARYRAVAETAATAAVESEVAAELVRADEAADLAYLLDQVPRAIERTLDGVGRVAEIVQAMKEFGHPHAQAQASADLNRAVRNTATVARNEIKYVADLVFELDDIPPVTCHLGEVNQVILILLVNAAQAISEGTDAGHPEHGTITVSTRSSDDRAWVTISVRDTGVGIPPEARDRVFEPFFTTKDVGRGTGQGLAIAARVCSNHGGSLSFETVLGEGTVFHVRLPVAGVRPSAEAPS